MTGYIYIGYNAMRRKNGVFKIGMTTRTATKRAGEIKRAGDKSFKVIGYIEIEKTTVVELLLIESILRYLAATEYKTQHFGNDHFAYSVNDYNAADIKDMAENLLNKTIEFSRLIIKNKIMNIIWAA